MRQQSIVIRLERHDLTINVSGNQPLWLISSNHERYAP